MSNKRRWLSSIKNPHSRAGEDLEADLEERETLGGPATGEEKEEEAADEEEEATEGETGRKRWGRMFLKMIVLMVFW